MMWTGRTETGVIWGPHWDASPYCLNLSNAFKGNHVIPQIAEATRALLAPIGVSAIEQSKIFKTLRKQNWYSNDNFADVFKSRLGSLHPELCDTVFIASELPRMLEELKKCKPYVQSSVMKTLFNSWTTSDRMHSDCTLPCLFGCRNEKDILSHYLRCPTLWRAIIPERDVYSCSWRDILGSRRAKTNLSL